MQHTKDRLLIFGSGFLVKHISEFFLSSGHEVRIVFNNHRVPDLDVVQIQKDKVDHLRVIQDFKPNYILCAYGDSFVGDNVEIQRSIQRNVIDTLTILESISNEISALPFIQAIVVIGSAAEYGKQFDGAIAESAMTCPTSIYGLTKIFLHNTCMYYFEKGLPIIYTRQFNSIGPFQRDVFVLSSLCKQIALIECKKQLPRIEVGNLLAERDFIDVRDTAKAYYQIFKRGKVGEVYNVGSGKAITIRVLLDILITYTTFNKEAIEIVQSRIGILGKNTLADRLLSDNKKLLSLGFLPEYSIDTTVYDTLNFWRIHVQ